MSDHENDNSDAALSRPFLALVSKLAIGEKAMPVRFMYRTVPADLRDTGWRMYTGYEDDAFLADKHNLMPYPLETLMQGDPTLEELLGSKPGSVWERVPNQPWTQVEDYTIPTEGDEIAERIQYLDLDKGTLEQPH